MALLVIRISIFVLIILFIIANIVIPAFMKNVPFFWMFKIRKAEKKFKPQIDKLNNDIIEKAVKDNIKRIKNDQ